MQVAFHLGAHCTDEDRLLRTLLQNKGRLASEGIIIPGPGRYRELVIKAAQKLKGNEAPHALQQEMIDTIADHDDARRVVLSCEDFLCVSGRIFENGMLYEKAGYKPGWFRALFSEHDVSFHIGIRNPVTFISAALNHPRQTHKTLNAFIQGADLFQVFWSDVIQSIRDHNPASPITVWCNEDSAIIWPQILQALSDHSDEMELKGKYNIAADLMTKDGLQLLQNRLRDTPPATEDERQDMLIEVLEAHARPEALFEEVHLPGWTASAVQEFTEQYEQDLEEIARIEGVTFLSV